MTNKIINKDERTTFIENKSFKSFKYGYNILTFGIFADMIYRNIWLHQFTGDLFLLVVLTAVIVTLYQYKQKIFSMNWIKKKCININNYLYFRLFTSFSYKKTFITK